MLKISWTVDILKECWRKRKKKIKQVDLNIFTITSAYYMVLKHCSTASDIVQ